MVAQILIEDAASATPAQISFHNSATYAPAAANVIEIGTPTDVQIDLTGVLDTQARASAKVDLGQNRAPAYVVTCCIETNTAPTTGELIEFYWASSGQSGATVGNPGYVSGSDADYTGSPATLAEGVAQLQFIGSLICSADNEFQIQDIGVFSPTHRYGCLVVKNECGQTICTDVVETAVVMTPIVPESQ